jgi:hypothetical protein
MAIVPRQTEHNWSNFFDDFFFVAWHEIEIVLLFSYDYCVLILSYYLLWKNQIDCGRDEIVECVFGKGDRSRVGQDKNGLGSCSTDNGGYSTCNQTWLMPTWAAVLVRQRKAGHHRFGQKCSDKSVRTKVFGLKVLGQKCSDKSVRTKVLGQKCSDKSAFERKCSDKSAFEQNGCPSGLSRNFEPKNMCLRRP